MVNFNKIYTSPSEELKRMAVYEMNKMWIENHNRKYEKGQVSFKVAMNKFGDLTDEEFETKFLNVRGIVSDDLRSEDHSFSDLMTPDVPESLNWTMKGAVTHVGDQKLCGACWAFSAAGAIEAQIFKKTGKLISLSEQNLVDCSREFGNKGCEGGMPFKALRYILVNGVTSEESYPYNAQEGKCQYTDQKQVVKIKALAFIRNTANKENTLKTAVARVGPISACVWSSKSFRFFSGGIFHDEDCKNNTKVNHAVLVVGYGREENQDYWLIKNSWGLRWGEYGYGKMVRNMDDHCNIASHNVFPIV
ncbi:Cat6 [Halyomorpha halys]|nr:Cat6 [Halyomorpha halys]